MPRSNLNGQTLVSVLSITTSPSSVSHCIICITCCLGYTTRQPENTSAMQLLHFPLAKSSLKQTSYPKGSHPSPSRLGLLTGLSHPLNLLLRKERRARKDDWAVPLRCLQSTALFCSYIFWEVEQVDAPNGVIPLWKLQRNKVNTMATYVSHYSQSSNIPSRTLGRTHLCGSNLHACE